jgi:hypothetical protein
MWGKMTKGKLDFEEDHVFEWFFFSKDTALLCVESISIDTTIVISPHLQGFIGMIEER